MAGAALTFSFGNVRDLARMLGVTGWITPLIAPAVDISVIGLAVAVQWLGLAGMSKTELRPATRLLTTCGVITLGLNCAPALMTAWATHTYTPIGRAAVEAVAPFLLIAWAHVGPELLRLFLSAHAAQRSRIATYRQARLDRAAALKQAELDAAAARHTAQVAAEQARLDREAEQARQATAAAAAAEQARLDREHQIEVARVAADAERARLVAAEQAAAAAARQAEAARDALAARAEADRAEAERLAAAAQLAEQRAQKRAQVNRDAPDRTGTRPTRDASGRTGTRPTRTGDAPGAIPIARGADGQRDRLRAILAVAVDAGCGSWDDVRGWTRIGRNELSRQTGIRPATIAVLLDRAEHVLPWDQTRARHAAAQDTEVAEVTG